MAARNSWAATPLHVAARHERTAVVEVLPAAAADATARDSGENTPLHGAVAGRRNRAIVEMLLAAGADVAARNDDGETPLQTAVRFSDPWSEAARAADVGVVEALLAAGADVKDHSCDALRKRLADESRTLGFMAFACVLRPGRVPPRLEANVRVDAQLTLVDPGNTARRARRNRTARRVVSPCSSSPTRTVDSRDSFDCRLRPRRRGGRLFPFWLPWNGPCAAGQACVGGPLPIRPLGS